MIERQNGARAEENKVLDLSKLVGFSAVGKAEVDFRDHTFAARIGAKTGSEDNGNPAPRE